MKRLAALLAALVCLGAAQAPLPDPADEARARALFHEIRCVVCQHESIAESPAGIAGDLRRMVREEIARGSTDAEIRALLVERYGDYVLFRPPFNAGTAALWATPFLLVLLVGGAMLLRVRRESVDGAPLDPDEEAALAAALGQPDETADSAISSPMTSARLKDR